MGLTRRGDDLSVQISRFEKALDQEIEKVATRFAGKFYRRLIRNIQSNAFGFTLSDSTLSQRIRHGAGTTPLIDTREYINAIIIEDATVTVRNGVNKGGLSFAELSEILEFGRRDRHVLPFPVWRMTYEQLLPDLNKEINRIIKKAYNA